MRTGGSPSPLPQGNLYTFQLIVTFCLLARSQRTASAIAIHGASAWSPPASTGGSPSPLPQGNLTRSSSLVARHSTLKLSLRNIQYLLTRYKLYLLFKGYSFLVLFLAPYSTSYERRGSSGDARQCACLVPSKLHRRKSKRKSAYGQTLDRLVPVS